MQEQIRGNEVKAPSAMCACVESVCISVCLRENAYELERI